MHTQPAKDYCGRITEGHAVMTRDPLALELCLVAFAITLIFVALASPMAAYFFGGAACTLMFIYLTGGQL